MPYRADQSEYQRHTAIYNALDGITEEDAIGIATKPVDILEPSKQKNKAQAFTKLGITADHRIEHVLEKGLENLEETYVSTPEEYSEILENMEGVDHSGKQLSVMAACSAYATLQLESDNPLGRRNDAPPMKEIAGAFDVEQRSIQAAYKEFVNQSENLQQNQLPG